MAAEAEEFFEVIGVTDSVIADRFFGVRGHWTLTSRVDALIVRFPQLLVEGFY
jgi:hypothetical protein